MHLRTTCFGVRYVGLCPSALFVLLLAGCSQPGLVLTTDLCDGLDNDTDGRVDEGRGEAIGCGAGEVCVDAMCGCPPGGCRGRTLSVVESCTAQIESSVMCGTYRPGDFGGNTPDESVTRCSSFFGALGPTCEQLLSDVTYCTEAAPCDLTGRCASEVMAFETTCLGSG